ncbi:MAG: DUF2520 domain-containing protein [Deltaproteobacteria bacterium]|nr:DUF2520 domain-containing protein [Deltaproteobacteria bacterium]
MTTIAIIGLGRVGTALAVLVGRHALGNLRVCDHNLNKIDSLKALLATPVTVCSTPAEAVAGAELVFLAVQDRHLAGLAENLAESLAGSGRADLKGCFFAHLSGALTSEVLRPLAARAAVTFSLHPLQSVAAAANGAEALAGSYFTFEGDERGLVVASDLVKVFGGHLVRLAAADKVLYHAAAVVSSNFFIALEEMAITLMTGIGVDAETARQMLLPLIRGSFDNLERVSPAEALTGPIVRGDDQTVAAHLAAIKKKFPEYVVSYRLLAGLNLDLAMQKGGVTPADFPSLKSPIVEIKP